MNKNQSKYFNTAIKMDEALLSLLEKKDFAYITIKEICGVAGVNRSTFYLHYENMSDLLEETLRYLNNKFNAYFDMDENETILKIEKGVIEELNFITKRHLEPYLAFIKEHKKIFIHLPQNIALIIFLKITLFMIALLKKFYYIFKKEINFMILKKKI